MSKIPGEGPCAPVSALLTDRQHARLTSVFTVDQHAAVEATWGAYQRIVSATGKTELAAVI
ncbi:hypothetical protein QFZ76_009985 [Streptomyces sp. V4I2]|nr:hypothetical protein [Streptomyces sp. V4I2]